MYKLEISSAARNDLADSMLWYNKQQNDLGKEFLEEVFQILDFTKDNPFLFPIGFSGKFRFSKLTRFPFVIVYEIVVNQLLLTQCFTQVEIPNDFKL